MLNQNKLNMLYDALGKVDLVEMVMKAEGMDLKAIQEVKEQISDKIKRA